MPLPLIRKIQTIAQSRFFTIEALHLLFSNGVERVYERLPAVGEPGVIVVAINDNDELLLIREYAAGFHEFQLTLPKGAAVFLWLVNGSAQINVREARRGIAVSYTHLTLPTTPYV